MFNFLYGKAKLKLWKEYALNFRLKSKSYYVPNKIYCNESDNFDYWLSKKRILICTRELNASLLSRSIKYLKGFFRSVEKKLSNQSFSKNAPKSVIEIELKKQKDSIDKIKALQKRLNALKA